MRSARTRHHRYAVAFITGLSTALAFCLPVHASDRQALAAAYRYLTTAREQGGSLYTIRSGPHTGTLVPFSFTDSPQYWSTHVCGKREDCRVIDSYDPSDYSIKPDLGVGGALQVERVNTHHGTNIYDAATWQIAVMLGHVRLNLHAPSAEPYTLISKYNRFLTSQSLRAVTTPTAFTYNGQIIRNPQRAYAFRMFSPHFVVTDPLMHTPLASLITARNLPPENPAYREGRITWADWKPFTGENAWAFLIGPLQAAHIHHVIRHRRQQVPVDDVAVVNALEILPTFSRMQSEAGGIYYAPRGTRENQGAKIVDPYFVAVENNLSVYAGFEILRRTLEAQQQNAPALTSTQKQQLTSALELIRVMQHGGRLDDGRSTRGLLAFFRHHAWLQGEFVQGGVANDPSQRQAWIPVTSPRAVDVNTWGIAALGSRRIDEWFGFGAAWRNWEGVKRWGAYGAGGELYGVGYSDQDGNGIDSTGAYRRGILSAEWTAGAIAAVRNMLVHYREVARTSAEHRHTALEYVRMLTNDERAMLQGLEQLRYDRYVSAEFPGKPANYAHLINVNSLPYLYASRRHFVPFGWFANPLPSTCATAWVVMLASNYDPFGFGGAPN